MLNNDSSEAISLSHGSRTIPLDIELYLELDHDTINRLFDLEKNSSNRFFERVVSIYIENAQRMIRQGLNDIEANSWKELARHAHTLKSSAAHVGASAFSKLFAHIEQLVHNQQYQDISTLWSWAHANHPQLITELKKYLNDNSQFATSGHTDHP